MRYNTQMIVHLDRLQHNYELLKQLTPNNQTLFMVKADGYGHGMVNLVRFACEKLKITEFGCASLGEAVLLREEIRKLEFEIYVFSDTSLWTMKTAKEYSEKRILPVISSMRDLDFILGQKDFRYLPICLKFDTGMNRLGFPLSEVDQVIDKLKKNGRKSVYHLLSHFSSSYINLDFNKKPEKQYELFKDIKKTFKASGIDVERTSMANSGAIEQNFALEESHIRPGLMLYGPYCYLDRKLPLDKPFLNISTLETNIIRVFQIKKGQEIGYGDVVIQRDGAMAIFALGYGDGLTLNYRGAKIEWKGFSGEFVGRMNMDMAMVLFPPEAFKHLKEGEKVILWDKDPQVVTKLAHEAHTITYELLLTISSRIPRQYTLK